jgi:hypothetical protein
MTASSISVENSQDALTISLNSGCSSMLFIFVVLDVSMRHMALLPPIFCSEEWNGVNNSMSECIQIQT